MKRIRVIGLALAAVFAISAIASASAMAALPELVNAKGEAVKGAVTGASEGETILESKSGIKVTCTSGTSTGEVTGLKTVGKTVVTFKGCKESIFGNKCQTKGEEAGKIVTLKIKGTIGYIKKAVPIEVGLDLQPEVAGNFVTFECGAFAKEEVKGSVIAPITPINTKVKTTGSFTLKYEKGASAGLQKVTKFEGGAEDVLESALNGGGFEKSNQQGTAKVKLAEEAELKA